MLYIVFRFSKVIFNNDLYHHHHHHRRHHHHHISVLQRREAQGSKVLSHGHTESREQSLGEPVMQFEHVTTFNLPSWLLRQLREHIEEIKMQLSNV